MRDFSVSLDNLAKVMTALTFALLAGVAAVSQSAFTAAIAGGILFVSYAFAPRGYVVAEGVLRIRRLAGDVRIPLETVRDARRATSDDLRCAIRLWASGGLFGYYGLFRTTSLGKSWWYVTDRAKAVVVETGEGPLVFSPDDVNAFVSAVRPHAPSPHPGPAPVRKSGWPLAGWIGVGVGVVTVAVVILAFGYDPGPPRYTLTAESLTIHDRLYPVTVRAETVDVAGIREVDPAAEPVWRTTARTNGFANSHYRAGWFRVAGGQKVRLYMASGTRLVLLPSRGDGAPILYGSRDPERFIREVREAWSPLRKTVLDRFRYWYPGSDDHRSSEGNQRP